MIDASRVRGTGRPSYRASEMDLAQLGVRVPVVWRPFLRRIRGSPQESQ